VRALDTKTPGLYLRTVAHLRPEQIVHRLRLRAQQAALTRWPGPFERRWAHAGNPPTWPADFVALDAAVPPASGSLEELERGTFTFLNESRSLGRPIIWNPADASQLWLYHQHYWEWAWTLAAHGERDRARKVFGEHLRTWVAATDFGRWNAWAPYPTSLRAWVFVNVAGTLAAGTALEGALHRQLQLHAGFVERNLELDVGGNHLVKNLKALLGLGVYFDDARLVRKAATHLQRQLPLQVLPDGGHFELSPSYHCQVLGDLIDMSNLLRAAGLPAIEGLDGAVARMRRWLGVMLMPDGDVPLLNDCELVGRERISALKPTAPPPGPLTVLPDSGYVVAKPGNRLHLVADVGRPCPPDLPAHAQADCLTFELAVDGARVVVDPGTSVYGSGPQRNLERSTSAHNTITVDDMDQTEVWGSFRAGRLAEASLHRAEMVGDDVEIVASHDGYARLPGSPRHRRRWLVSPSSVDITDWLDGSGSHRVRARLLFDADHLTLDAAARLLDGQEADGREFKLSMPPTADAGQASSGLAVSVSHASHAVGFGDVRTATEIVAAGHLRFPTRLQSRIVLVPSQAQDRP